MKGISTVVATILMLAITIALAGTAYLYISGVVGGQTAVVLGINDAICNNTPSSGYIVLTVSNEGTGNSPALTCSARSSGGASAGSGTGLAVNAGATGTCTVARSGSVGAGTYTATVGATGARPASGPVSCSG